MKRLILIMSALAFTTAVAPAEAEAARRPVPPASVQVAPAKVWVPAHRAWSVQLGRFITVSGQWQAPPRAGMTWIPGHYEGRGHNRRWVSGRWAPAR